MSQGADSATEYMHMRLRLYWRSIIYRVTTVQNFRTSFFIAFLSSYGCINKADKVSLTAASGQVSLELLLMHGLSKIIVYISSLIVVPLQSIYYANSVV